MNNSLTTKYTSDYADAIYKNMKANTCFSVIAPPRIGNHTVLKSIIKNWKEIYKADKEFANNTAVLTIDLHFSYEEVLKELIGSINFYLNENEHIPVFSRARGIEEGLDKIVEKGFKEILITVSGASRIMTEQQDIINIIFEASRAHPSVIQFLFLFSEELDESEQARKLFGRIALFLYETRYYMQLFTDNDMDQVIRSNLNESNIEESEELVNNFKTLSGNNVGLFKILLREYLKSGSLPESSEQLLTLTAVRFYFTEVWASFSEATQLALKADPHYENEYLQKTALRRGGVWFSPAFNLFLNSIENNPATPSDIPSLERLLTWQELTLYNLLQANKGNVVSRDEIAKEIWKDQWVDKYSDWAIAQLVSQLRKKSSAFSGITIKTVPNEGFTMLGI